MPDYPLMKPYRLKDRGGILAQKFRESQDRGSWPPFVEKHRWKAGVYEVRCNDRSPFTYEDVADGDWVTIGASGWRHVVKPLEFEARYEEAGDGR